MDEKILIVDDEPNVLEGLQRVLRKEFNVVAAIGGEAGLKAVAEQGPFAVIVSDMRMPGMDGTQFLRTVLERTPDSVRLALTGNADIQTAIDAVNEGAIFRFLSKPCTEQVLKGALRAAIAQHRLILAERELLEKTLHGSVKVLTEILALVNPAAFSRASRIHQTVLGIVHQLKLPDAWSYEIAAMLSQIGCVALDAETVEAVYGGVELPAVEQERFRMHPSIAYEFLKKIPRLETVALMIAAQQNPAEYKFPQGDALETVAAKLGAEILSVAIDFDQILMTRITRAEAIGRLKERKNKYNPRIVAALENVPVHTTPFVCQEIYVRQMTVGMILDEDLRAPSGMLLVARDQEISYPLLVRIRNFCQKVPMTHKIRVRVVRPEEMTVREHEHAPALS
jgi:response regulator RpfG family c-di-GMP phosphodiesterase